MKKKFNKLFTRCILLLSFIMISCGRKGTKTVYACNIEQQANVSLDIKNSIQASNNMSDEEMEDVIQQLEKTFIRTNCPQKKVNGVFHDGWFEITDFEEGINYYEY